jgi:ribosomal protein S18 acetylase RimI-like enzyme
MMIKYREAKLADANQVAKVMLSRYNVKSRNDAIAAFLREIKKDNYIVAENGGSILGFIVWDMHGMPHHQLVKIERLAVSKFKHDKGVAEHLVRIATDHADRHFKKMGYKLRKMYINTHSTDKERVRMLKGLGFIQEAKLEDHFYKGVDEYIFSMFFE